MFSKALAQAVKDRRSIYNISKDVKVSDERIREVIEFAVKWTPSAFNSQSARFVLLLRDHHDKFWDNTKEILRGIVPADKFGPTDSKINSFKAGYGTVLFFEDQTIIKGMQEKFALYSHHFPSWSEQANGMNQLVIWTGLEAEGLGCSLQHYNPLVDGAVAKEWGVPATWKLIAQMPFGHPTAPAGEKTFLPIEDRLKVFQ